jgi:hypothetical protein
MTIKAKFDKRVQELGAIVQIGGGRYWTLCLEAPKGKIWTGVDVHEVVHEQDHFTTRDEIYQNALEDMRMGVRDCEDAECDWCHS